MNGRFAAPLALALAACGSSSPGPGPVVPEARSTLARDTSPSVGAGDVAAVVAGNDAFALDLHRRLVEPGQNAMTSPYSASTALAMLWAGARGDTASQMAGALHFPLPQERFHPAYDALDLALREPPPCGASCPRFALRIANDAWAQQGASFVPAFLDTLAVSYDAGVSLLDFAGAPDASRRTINDAVAHETEGRIQDLLPDGTVDGNTRLVLTNAVYFKAAWKYPFDPRLTAPGPFQLQGGSAVSVPFMHGTVAGRGTTQPAYDAVELPYDDGSDVPTLKAHGHFTMTIIAPKAGTFEAFESAFDAAALQAVDAAMTPASVAVSIPKFGFRWQKSLVPTLEAMGMVDAFDPELADLSGISAEERLYVKDVLQQTFVAVDEQGTEAAAATAVVVGVTAVPQDLTIGIDRPFLFLVRDTTTGQILFLGRVVDPR